MSISRGNKVAIHLTFKAKVHAWRGGTFPQDKGTFPPILAFVQLFLIPGLKKKSSLKMKGKEITTTTEIIFC